jgi:ribosomal protein S18 acetylase RimI-like enzyme
MLARAFVNDPVAIDLFPSETGRADRMQRFFSIQIRHTYLPRGEVLTFADHSSVALVIWPDAPKASTLHQLASLRLVPLLGMQVLVAQQMARSILATHPSTPHAYLGTIGTDRDHQGRGRASALIEHIARRCDAEQLGCRLEASTTANVRFYQHFGFECIQELSFRAGGPSLYVMHRLANSAEDAPPLL